MNPIPFVRYVFLLIGSGILYWLFRNITFGIYDSMSGSSNYYGILLHMGYSFIIILILIIGTAKFLIDVRREV